MISATITGGTDLALIAKMSGRSADKPTRGLAVLRDMNSRAILHLLRANTPCSCSDLARYSGLTAPTVASSVARLERLGLVKRLGAGNSSGGRPPFLLGFNERYGFVAGVDLTATGMRVGIADLRGKLLGQAEEKIGDRSWPAAIVERIAHHLAALREEFRIPAKRLLSIGVAAPGITDVAAGVVVSVPTMRAWENVPLRRLIEARTGVAVTVENDVNLAALAEHWHGVAQQEDNFVFIAVGQGVGAGLFINGRLHHGPEWTAGEIGYLLVPGAARQAIRRSQSGSLESAIGTAGIESQWRPRGALCAKEIMERAASGDPPARRIVRKSAKILAEVCSNLSLILNCPLIVLGGELGMCEPLFSETRALLDKNDFARPRLSISQSGKDAQLLGAVRLALQGAEAALA
jgi:glucokinase